MSKQIVDPFVTTPLPSLRGAKPRGNLHGIHAAMRLPLGRELEAERLRFTRDHAGKTRSTAGRQEGWTLIEVLVAVVILCVGLLAVGTMQISAIRGNFFGGNTSIALTLAGQKMEDLLNRNYADLELANGAHPEERLNDSGVAAANGLYRRSWNITDTVTGAANWPVMKEITVLVTWEGTRHRVTISSMRRP